MDRSSPNAAVREHCLGSRTRHQARIPAATESYFRTRRRSGTGSPCYEFVSDVERSEDRDGRDRLRHADAAFDEDRGQRDAYDPKDQDANDCSAQRIV